MFDVLVIGGGHAGCEAAAAAARRGARVGLITFASTNLGQLSCNPSIGGVGKGHLVREIDVFDGLMAVAADQSAVHYRMLNRSKGAAVHGPRVQVDRSLYRAAIERQIVASRIAIIPGEVMHVRLNGTSIAGVTLASGKTLACRALIVTTGTFLGGRTFRGDDKVDGGRVGEPASNALADQFSHLGMTSNRLKTGTPPRIDGRSIDWAALVPQPTDADHWTMSALPTRRAIPQLDCAITRTTAATHAVIATNFDRSPLFAGKIEGRGPRYCPSIEDKIKRFGDRDGHQIFLEPEGLGSHLVYPNGLSTSLPAEVQNEFVSTIPGLSRAVVVEPGYAVDYAHLDPRALHETLQHGSIAGLFLAGQINGTTGYEEAAAQGLVAGLNAAAVACELAPVRFDRASSYIGVMLDDLTVQGVIEPYRMLTARAEYRLHLRADNATSRLGEAAIASGAVGNGRRSHIEDHTRTSRQANVVLDQLVSSKRMRPDLKACGARPLRDWLANADYSETARSLAGSGPAALEAVADAIYEPYLARQRQEWRALEASRAQRFPANIDFQNIPGLSHEMVERLTTANPSNLEQAGRIRGITPAALSALHFAIARSAA